MMDLETIEEQVYKLWKRYSGSDVTPWLREQLSGEYGQALAVEFNQSAIGYITFLEKLDDYLMNSSYTVAEDGEDIIIYKIG